MAQELKQLAVVRSYRELIAVLRSRADEREITRQGIDNAGRLPPGYSATLLCQDPVKNLGRNSLGAILSVLDLDLIVVERT